MADMIDGHLRGNKCMIVTQQDWHYASELGLSMGTGVRIISTKTALEKFAMISIPHPAWTFVCDMSGSKFRQQRHRDKESTHVNSLLSSTMTMGSTSCKPSQDVSKRSREQILPITISLPSPPPPPPPPLKKKKVCILRLGPYIEHMRLCACPITMWYWPASLVAAVAVLSPTL